MRTPTRGPAPASEPETKAVMRMIEAHRPEVVYSFHWMGICANSFLVAARSRGDAAFTARAERWAKAYGGAFPCKSTVQPLCTAGSLAAWLYRSAGIVGMDLECPGDDQLGMRYDRYDRALLAEYQVHHRQGMLAALRSLAEEQGAKR